MEKSKTSALWQKLHGHIIYYVISHTIQPEALNILKCTKGKTKLQAAAMICTIKASKLLIMYDVIVSKLHGTCFGVIPSHCHRPILLSDETPPETSN